MGILFALIALIAWGFGDFLIEKSTRKFGDVVPLFYIAALATIVLLPFVYRDLGSIIGPAWSILLTTGILITIVAFLEFEALRIGKISVIEPIMAFELPVTAALSFVILRETISPLQLILLGVLLIGIFFVSTRSFGHLTRVGLERGVLLAVIATLVMGTVNFFVSVGARVTTPLMIHWFTSAFIAFFCLAYLIIAGRTKEILNDWRKGSRVLFSVSLTDNIAWIAYAFAVTYIPIAIATGISESYIALAAGLGLFFNREKLKPHQKIGLAICIAAVIVLSIVTER